MISVIWLLPPLGVTMIFMTTILYNIRWIRTRTNEWRHVQTVPITLVTCFFLIGWEDLVWLNFWESVVYAINAFYFIVFIEISTILFAEEEELSFFLKCEKIVSDFLS